MAMWVIWVGLGVVFLVVEMLGPSLVSIWFAIAALIMAPVSLLKWPLPTQIAVFLVISVALLIPLRKLYKDKIRPKDILPDNLSDQTVQRSGIVTKTIDLTKDEGQILIGDVYWNAESADGSVIEEGEKVVVVKVEHMKAFVEKA